MEKVIIVAIADNNAIGRDNALLWHISEDLKFFKRTTSGCPVIMGRKTYESIGRPLPGRKNIVVSRGFEAPEGVAVAASLEVAYGVAAEALAGGSATAGLADGLAMGSAMAGLADGLSAEVECPAAGGRCFVIGGGQIYAQALETADRLIITHVHTVIEDADTFFPVISPEVWTVASRSEMMIDPETGYEFEFVEYIHK